MNDTATDTASGPDCVKALMIAALRKNKPIREPTHEPTRQPTRQATRADTKRYDADTSGTVEANIADAPMIESGNKNAIDDTRQKASPGRRIPKHSGTEYGYKQDLGKIFRQNYHVTLFLGDDGEPHISGNFERLGELQAWVDANRQYVIDRLLENSRD